MRVPNLKELMHDPCQFLRYEGGKLWYHSSYTYQIGDKTHHALFEFPVPVDDAGEGSFGIVERPITLMRWMRKHIEYLNGAINGQT